MGARKTAVAVLACAAAVAVVSTRVWVHLNVAGEPHVARYAMQDFRDAVYYPVVAFLHGDDPYDQPRYTAAYPVADGFALYSPLTLLVHAPVALLPYRAAELVYYVGSVALTLALGALALALCGVPLTLARVAGLGAALLISRPGHWNLFNGQVTLQVVIPMLIALWCARDRPLLAGIALAITTLKPTYGLPLAALLAVRGDWRALVVGGVVAGVLTALVLVRVVTAAGGAAPFIAAIEASYAARGLEQRKRPEHSPFRVDAIALAGRLLGRSPTNAETLVLTFGVLAVAALALRRLGRDERPASARADTHPPATRTHDARLHTASVASLATVACAYHQQYDLVILAVPLAALWWRADAWPWRAHARLRRIALVAAVVPLANYLGSETGVARLGWSRAALLAASSVDNVALLMLLGLFVAAGWDAAALRPSMRRR